MKQSALSASQGPHLTGTGGDGWRRRHSKAGAIKRRDAIELLACTSASTLALPTRQAAQEPSALDAAEQLRPLHLAEQALTTDYQGRALALHFLAMR